jgi:hypothetical protein
MARQQTPPPGWFPDHRDPSLVRFWNGREWTAQTAPAHPPAPTGQPLYGATPAGPWKRLRRRTKVLLVVAALVVAGALMPDEVTETEPAAARADSQRAQTDDDRSAESTEVDEASEEAVEEEPVEEEPVDEEPLEEVVEEISVPALRSTPIGEARKVLRQAGLVVEVVRQPSWDPVGTVLKQGTKAGTALTTGEIVRLVVAVPMPRVPGVLGRGAEAARAALGSAGFKVAVVTKEVPSGASNVVLGQTPAATDQAAPGSVVRLVVSKVVAPPPPPPPPAPPVSNCTAGYRPCLEPASDYDCAGGSGDGPGYAYGPIYITGSDPYDLDSDGDGVACES